MKSSSIFIFVINERAINMIMVFCTYFATDSKYQYDESYFYQQQYDEEYYVLQTKQWCNVIAKYFTHGYFEKKSVKIAVGNKQSKVHKRATASFQNPRFQRTTEKKSF